MDDRLQQCLEEITSSSNCTAKVRQILESVNELSDIIYSMDANDFEEYIESDDFVEDVSNLFDIDISE